MLCTGARDCVAWTPVGGFRRIWSDFVGSFDHEHVAACCAPKPVAIAAGATIACALCLSHIPLLRDLTGLRSALVPAAFLIAAAFCSVATWFFGSSRDLAALFQLLDLPCYALGILSLGWSGRPVGMYLALLLYMVCLVVWGMVFARSLLNMTSAILVPLLVTIAAGGPLLVIVAIPTFGAAYFVMTHNTAEKQRLNRRYERSGEILRRVDELTREAQERRGVEEDLRTLSFLHRHKNALVALKWSLDDLSLADGPTAENAEILDDMRSDLEQAAASVERLLDESREELDAAPFFRAADLAARLRLADARWPTGFVELLLGDPEAAIRGSLENALVAVANLIENSREAGAFKVRIDIGADVDREMVRIAVSDDGPGLPKTVRDRLFEPFNTHGKGEPGCGLGLYLSRRLVEALDGDIQLEESGAAGARFAIALPMAAPADHAHP